MASKEPTIQEEASLPSNWRVVDSAPIVPGSLPQPNAMQNYFGGSIDPVMLQSNAGLRDTQIGSHLIPKLPLMPISLSGAPTAGSAIQSGSTTTIDTTTNAVAAGPNGAVQFSNGGALAGSGSFVFNSGTNTLTVSAGVNVTGSVTITGSLVLTGTISADIFNAGTGFQIGSAAASGKYLRGNGTNFVSATLSGTDVQTGLVGVAFGGTGTATPSLVAGNDITITGSWPDQTAAVKTQGGVTPGSYTNTNLTVDAQGIITAVSNGSGSGLLTATVTVPSASILTIFSVPYQVLPAPGANKTYLINAVLAHYRFNTTAYTLSGGSQLNLIFNADTAIEAYDVAVEAGFLDQTTDSYNIGFSLGANILDADAVNKAVHLWGSGADPTLGDGTVTLTIQYTIVDVTIT